MRIRKRATVVVATLLLVVVPAACSFLSVFECRAPCSRPLTQAQVLHALENVPATELRVLSVTSTPTEVWSAESVRDRTGITRAVHYYGVALSRDPPEIRVSVSAVNGDAAGPDERARVEDLCRRISAACPEVGAWEDGRVVGPPTRAERILTLAICLSFPVGAVLATVWLVRRASRRAEARRRGGATV